MSNQGDEISIHNHLGPTIFAIPHDRRIATLAKKAALATTLRVDDLVSIILGDPTLTLHLLRSANSIKASADKRPTASLKTAIIRLGSQAIINLISDLEEQVYPTLQTIHPTLKQLKKRAVITSQIAELLARETNQRSTEECLITGLLYNSGELLELAKLGDIYIKLAASNGRAQLMYLLHINHDFEIEGASFDLLQGCGIPSSITSAISPTSQNQGASNSIRPIVLTAIEFIDAFQEQRLSRFAPGRPPPARSAVRMLSLSSARYEKLFGQIVELLNSSEAEDTQSVTAPEEPPVPEPPKKQNRDSEETRPVAVTAPPLKSAHAEGKPHDPEKNQVPPKNVPSEAQPPARIVNANGWQHLYRLVLDKLCRADQFFRAAILVKGGESLTITFDPPGGVVTGLPLFITSCPELETFLKPGVEVSSPLNPSHQNSPFGGIAYGIGNCAEASFPQVFLYADCGSARSLPPGAERLFHEGLALLSRSLSADPALVQGVTPAAV